MRAESLQWRALRWLKAFITARTITGVAEKSLRDASCDDPRTPLSGVFVHVQPNAAVVVVARFVAAAAFGRSPTAAIAAGFSTATTAEPFSGTPGCSNAPSHAPAEISFRILSTNTLGFAAAVIASFDVALCVG